MSAVTLDRFTPAVSRRARLLTAGVVWSGVGVMLSAWAAVWLLGAHDAIAGLLAAAGVLVALAAWRFGFSRISAANALRIVVGPARACLFGFQAPKSYLIMAAMIALGTALRHSAVPKPWLAVVYAGVGGALFLSSLDYYRTPRTAPVRKDVIS